MRLLLAAWTRAPRIAFAALAAALFGLAAAPGLARETFHGLAFPNEIGGARFAGARDFEREQPGLGYGVRYSRTGWAIDIFIYDRGLRSIPDDLRSPVLKTQLDAGRGDVIAAYINVKATGSHDIEDGNGRPRFRCLSFNFNRSDRPGNYDSFLCIAAWNNKFVKFRMTAPAHAGSDDEAKDFMRAWLPVLWPH